MVKIYFKKINISKNLLRNSKLSNKHFKTNTTSTLILPLLLWKIIEVYNGKKYIPININKKKIGFFLKNFIYTQKSKSKFKEFNINLNN